MIGKIKGVLEFKNTHQALIDVGGLCYEVEVPVSTAFELPDVGASVSLFTHFVVREDAQLLYGFRSLADRDTFRILIRVNGVGPKLGIAILSGLSASDLSLCVANEDVSALVKLPGIGKKTAERLLIELRDKLKGGLPNADDSQASSAADSSSVKVESEAEAALIALGYKPIEAAKLVKAHYKNGMAVQDLIKQALRSLN